VRIAAYVAFAVLVFAALGFSKTEDCGCASSPPNRLEGLRACAGETPNELPQATTEGMEWQCEYWYECVEYGMRECDPCYSLCMAGCVVGCWGLSGWKAMLCNLACSATCEACPDCEVCVRWERQQSCAEFRGRNT